MKIIAFLGSPRNDGTTRFVVGKLLQGAKAAGAETRLYNLNELNFKGCQGCRKCKEQEKCDLVDDLTPVYDEILQADLMVVASPIYMAYVTGQTKLFLDRLYALKGADQVSRVPAGKKSVLVLTQGYADENAYENMIKSVSSLISRFGFEVVDTMVVGGVYSPADPAAQGAAVRALDLGQLLVNKHVN